MLYPFNLITDRDFKGGWSDQIRNPGGRGGKVRDLV